MSGSEPTESDPALLAFVKCHITSLAKWEVLRVLASQDGGWIPGDQLVHQTHRHAQEVVLALTELISDGLVELLAATTPDDQVRYRLTLDEPTSVVLKRLIDSATHSQELRAIIAAQLQHLRQQTQDELRASMAAA
ncbi:MAG: hypothetical protein JO057_11555 [Chloroflexi bacterium]|nr:hypothetical protein [Chloroflexota bacterium]